MQEDICSELFRRVGQQQCSKMSIPHSVFIIWLRILPFWKAYEILYNFDLEHFSRFWRLLCQIQTTSSTVPEFWQHINLILKQLYFTIYNRYWGDSRAKRMMLKSTYLHINFMTIGQLFYEIWTDKDRLLRLIKNGQHDKMKPNYLFIIFLNLNLN